MLSADVIVSNPRSGHSSHVYNGYEVRGLEILVFGVPRLPKLGRVSIEKG